MRSTFLQILLFSGTWSPWEVLLEHSIRLCCEDYFSSSSVVSRAFSALCVYSKFRHHPHPLCYLCSKFYFISFAASIAELAHGEKSRTQSPNHSLTHPVYLIPREPKLALRKSWNVCLRVCMTAAMASRINFYSELAISLIRISDIANSE